MFNSIVLDQWDRKPYFDHYLNQVRCTYSITANLDITLLINELKLKGLKFYPALRTCFDAKPNEPPNIFPVSSIPWVNFMGFNLNIYNEGTYLLPIFTMGKYVQQNDKVYLPLSIQLHHAVCDGYHAGVLFTELQSLADQCHDWC
ncbi:hypothetical protein J7E78_23935 [Paenibacillus polymyxa]|uniref:CatA-like O-acetyltransferase n=1 Tax=Paenibacillus polymyxa TaxID=1406 RepID=UPI001BE4F2B2|nr:CatA-like O-acetyltransferase [Paenibacillus polymyxa]MBT2286578.1 hypothetical protein [Paenibacillus polymyxa]